MKNKRLKEIEERLAEIKGIVDSDENVENIDALNTEADQLLAERNKILENIQNYQQLRQKIADGSIGTSVDIGGNTDAEKFEERAKKFASTKRTSIDTTQLRAALVSSGKLATPTAVSGINDTVGAKHSSIIDLVKIVDCGGMGSNKVAYIDTDADAAAEHTEGSAATAKEATFGYVEITPKTLATYAQISEQAKNQTPLQYETKVQEQALIRSARRPLNLLSPSSRHQPSTKPSTHLFLLRKRASLTKTPLLTFSLNTAEMKALSEKQCFSSTKRIFAPSAKSEERRTKRKSMRLYLTDQTRMSASSKTAVFRSNIAFAPSLQLALIPYRVRRLFRQCSTETRSALSLISLPTTRLRFLRNLHLRRLWIQFSDLSASAPMSLQRTALSH